MTFHFAFILTQKVPQPDVFHWRSFLTCAHVTKMLVWNQSREGALGQLKGNLVVESGDQHVTYGFDCHKAH